MKNNSRGRLGALPRLTCLWCTQRACLLLPTFPYWEHTSGMVALPLLAADYNLYKTVYHDWFSLVLEHPMHYYLPSYSY